MSDILSPLGDISLADAAGMRSDLLRCIMSGTLSVRYSDGTSITYRDMNAMKTALTEIDGRISAATAQQSNLLAPDPVRVVRFMPSSGWR